MPSKQARNFVATIWNVENTRETYEEACEEHEIAFFAWGEEECPKSGKKHHQAFFCMEKKIACGARTLNKLGDWFGEKHCFIQAMNGSIKQSEAYCSKEGSYQTIGSLPSQGERTDLNTLKTEIYSGKRKFGDILDSDPVMIHKYGRTLTLLEDRYLRKQFRTEMTKGIWYVGGTGVGKSHKAFEGFHPDTHYQKVQDGLWWEDYAGQETVIINDFRGDIPYDMMLQLVDKWPFKVPRRGRSPMPFTSKTVIVTSVLSPEEVYHNRHDKDSLDQLLRRFEIIHLGEIAYEADG